jgi:hypothetical protein
MRAIISVAAVVLLVVVTVSAQRPVMRSVFVSAVDLRGRPVLDLTPEEFQLTEDGTARAVTRATLGKTPLRIVLLVDSSTPVGPMMSSFRNALNAFVDWLPETEDIVFISSGSQIRVRTRPGDPREKLRAEIARFSAEGGANAFLDTLLEADERFMKTAPEQWPVFVILTTDNGAGTREPDVKTYNAFMNDFLARGGVAHAVIVSGKRVGSTTDLVANLVDNTGGKRATTLTDNTLTTLLTEIADRVAGDHVAMLNRYEVAFAGDPKLTQPTIKVGVNREGVAVQMSVRRPF